MLVCVSVVLLYICICADAFQLNFGECPVYFYERCTHTESVKFVLSTKTNNETEFFILDPLNPELPKHFNRLIPLKIVVHGYGGLDIDFSTATVIETYEEVGYNVITGLDPALPFFATLSNDWKLDKTDADFVDVIHTSSGTFGKLEATGHVDFYVNGGVLQPACLSKKYPPLCSHIMAGLYFAESIKSSVYGGKSFIARQCENIVQYFLGLCDDTQKLTVMGENAYYLTRGTFFLETNDKAPYALGFKSSYFKNGRLNPNKTSTDNCSKNDVNTLC
ncbi:pancreatic lipase-related protein 3-like isoform X2 [Rhynchophorus ferrugineus]|uniref:pancreatic lipase-related protein 3-like isoform X2 n=1 Tax=Rhynchophorus ferrugineus TaxID=354439 RepID=UPI003FCE844A